MKLIHCPTHALILDLAREEIEKHQRFMKKSVLRATRFASGGWENHIVWPFIRQQIEKELGGELLTPISETLGKWDPHIHPEKFLPGARHQTTGYARATVLAPEVVGKWVERRYNSAVGVWHGMERMIISCQKQGIAIGYHPVTLPRLKLPESSAAA